MKKLTLFAFVFVLLISGVYANAFATIGMKGLSFVSPQLGQVINTALCISNPLVCLEGKIIGQISGAALQAVAEVSPEAAKAISTYNQIKGYIETGAQVVN